MVLSICAIFFSVSSYSIPKLGHLMMICFTYLCLKMEIMSFSKLPQSDYGTGFVCICVFQLIK